MTMRFVDEFPTDISDFLLPPSHKVVVLLDHGAKFSKDTGHMQPIMWPKKSNESVKVGEFQKKMWSVLLEAIVEMHRVVSDLFPDGSKLLRFVTSDYVARSLNTEWGDELIEHEDMRALFRAAGPPVGGDEAYSMNSGVTVAVEALSERTGLHTKYSQMDEREVKKAAMKASRGFANVPRGKDHDGHGRFRLLNKGSIIILTTMNTDAEISELESDLVDVIRSRNKILETLEDKSFVSVDHVNLFILNLHPVGAKPQVENRPLTKMNDYLSSGVLCCPALGSDLFVSVHAMLIQTYDLVSTTVTNIPMKEDSQQSTSVNYDVELLHPKVAHAELSRHNLLHPERAPKGIQFPDEKDDDVVVVSSTVPKEDATPKHKMVVPVHNDAYQTVKLQWATPTAKMKWTLFPRARQAFPVTPTQMYSRPSVCLTSFLSAGKNVMLEVVKAAPGAEKLEPMVGEKIISHTLIAHSGRIYIHEIHLGPHSVLDNKSAAASCAIKPDPGLRVTDFIALMKEMTIAFPPEDDEEEGAAKEPRAPTPDDEEDDFNSEARKHLRRVTRYWPLRLTNSFIYQIPKKFEPLLSIMKQPELSTADVDQCKQAITAFLAHREGKEPLTHIQLKCRLSKNIAQKDVQMKIAILELAAHMLNYVNHSERHLEVFRMYAQLCGHEVVAQLPTTDVELDRKRKQLLRVIRKKKQAIKVLKPKYGERPKLSSRRLPFARKRFAQLQPSAKSTSSVTPLAQLPKRSRPNSTAGLWAAGETMDIFPMLLAQKRSAANKRFRDFAGRIEAGSRPAKLYPKLELSDRERQPRGIVGD